MVGSPTLTPDSASLKLRLAETQNSALKEQIQTLLDAKANQRKPKPTLASPPSGSPKEMLLSALAKRKLAPTSGLTSAPRKVRPKTKTWTTTNVEAPTGPLSMQVAAGVTLATLLEVAGEFAPSLPSRKERWVTLTPGAGNAQPVTLYKRLASLFVGHDRAEWIEAHIELGLTGPTAATAGYVLLYVAYVIRETGRVPDNFPSTVFEPTGSPIKERLQLPANGAGAFSGKRLNLADEGLLDVGNTAQPKTPVAPSPAKRAYMLEQIAEAKAAGNFELAFRLFEELHDRAPTSPVGVTRPKPILKQDGQTVPPPAASSTPTANEAMMLQMIAMVGQLTEKLSPGKSKDEDDEVTAAVPIPGGAVTGDSLFQRGELPDSILRSLRLYKYICYQTVYHNSSAASLVGRATKKSITLGRGTKISIDADGSEMQDASASAISTMSYTQWDTAARIVERAMAKERPAEIAGFLQHQERVRQYQRNYRETRETGYLEYDMMVRRLAAVAQAGLNPRPFDWAAECVNIHRQCFAGYAPGKCEICGSIRHYTDQCKPTLLAAEKSSRGRGGYGEGGGGGGGGGGSGGGGGGNGDTPPGGKKSRRQRGREAKEAREAAGDGTASTGGGKPPGINAVCHGWNSGNCNNRSCRFQHNKCRSCGGQHRWTDPTCPKFVGEDVIAESRAAYAKKLAAQGGGRKD